MKKAAVVIGVDRTGDLTPLQSAATGALEVAGWLEGEGFDVACLTDANAPVTGLAVTEAIERYVTLPATYGLLLVYFSGHGYWHAFADRWLLSGAPGRASEAVNLRAAMDLAQYSGIPNVVFVSDACRSIPISRAGMMVEGVAAFPVFDSVRIASKVDSFKATGESRAAYEGQVDGAPRSLLTAALRSAYATPDPAMVRTVTVEGEAVRMVPNRLLEDYLQRKVDALLSGIDRRLRQDIVVNVPSSENVYISRVALATTAPPMTQTTTATAGAGSADESTPVAVPLPRDDALAAFATVRGSLRSRAFVGGRKPPLLADQGPSVEGRLRRRMPDRRQAGFESGTGFVVNGAVLVQAVLRTASRNDGCTAELLAAGDGSGTAALVRLRGPGDAMRLPDDRAGALALRFADGRSTVLAALPGYVGHVTVKHGGVAGVSYVPSQNGARWSEYQAHREEMDRLRAMVSLAMEQEAFQLGSLRDATALAERIRPGRSVDPTLGVYAAHAFSQSGNDALLGELLERMRADLGVDLFDVRLLANRLRADEAWGDRPMVPPCPMLSQTWALVGARSVVLPEPLRAAGAHLCDSLWTTFEPEAGDAFMAWMAQGDEP